MPTSSIDKDFVLDSQKAIESFAEILSERPKPIIVDRSRTSQEVMERGKKRLLQLLSKRK